LRLSTPESPRSQLLRSSWFGLSNCRLYSLWSRYIIYFIPPYTSIAVSQYISFKKKVVKSSEKIIQLKSEAAHLRTSTSTWPVPEQAVHFWRTSVFPEPLHDLHACFSKTVTSFTIICPRNDILLIMVNHFTVYHDSEKPCEKI
jgi:hypothetical protein